MRAYNLFAVLFVLAVVSVCRAQVAPPPQSQDKQLTSGDAKVDSILDLLEAKGKNIKGLRAKLTYTYVVVDPVESRQVKEGKLLFSRAESNYRFLIHFDRMIADGVVRSSGEYFGFDGRWLVERNDLARNIIKREVAPEGSHIDPFKLGEGPFPMPFGQKRSDILENFRVTLIPFALGDPLQTDHLRCVPNPGTELAQRYSRVDLYVDRRVDLPVRIVTENVKDGNRIEVDFKDMDVGDAPRASRFAIEEPKDFEVRIEQMEAKSPEDKSK